MGELVFYIYSFVWFFLGIGVIVGMWELFKQLRKDESRYNSTHAPRLFEFMMGLAVFLGAVGHLGIGFFGGWTPADAPRLLAQIALWDGVIVGLYVTALVMINRFMASS